MPTSIPQLYTSLGRPTVVAGVVVVLVVVLALVGVLRRRRAYVAAGLLTGAGSVVVLLGVLSLTLFGPQPLGTGEPQFYLDPVDGAWGWSSIAWGPVVDNVALFVPVGALLAAVLWRRHVLVAWGVAIALSVAIESFQYLVPTGRVANTADILANAAGAGLGVLLAVLAGARSGTPAVDVSRVGPRSAGPGR